MKLLLSCDETFELLTSGCQSAGEKEALQEHLECCTDCRQFAGATGPAADLFADALREDAGDRGDAPAIARTVFARLEAEQQVLLAESHRRTFFRLSPHAWSQLAAAAAVLMALGGLL